MEAAEVEAGEIEAAPEVEAEVVAEVEAEEMKAAGSADDQKEVGAQDEMGEEAEGALTAGRRTQRWCLRRWRRDRR